MHAHVVLAIHMFGHVSKQSTPLASAGSARYTRIISDRSNASRYLAPGRLDFSQRASTGNGCSYESHSAGERTASSYCV